MNPLNNLPSAVSGAIPARAGFTSWPRAPRSGPADHPRSRGVYWLTSNGRYHWAGSSPLARGLQLADPWNLNEPALYQTPAAFTADPGPVPPGRESSAVVRGAARR